VLSEQRKKRKPGKVGLWIKKEQVCVQLYFLADNMALPSFAVARHAAVQLLLTTGCALVQQLIYMHAAGK